MPYIGNNLATQFQAFATQTITGDGSTGYTLDRAVANGKELLVYINNVKQEEGSGKAYEASGTTITFSEAVASGDSCYLVYMGSAQQTVTAPAGSIVSSQFSSADLSLTGNVGIGTSSINRKLEISGNNNGGAKANYIRITDTDTTATANNQMGGIEFFSSDSSGGAGISASIETVYAGSGGGGELTFNTNASSGGTLTEAMRIDETGHITKPLQPAFLVFPSLDQDNIANGDTIVFDSEIFDQNGDFSSNTFTAPVTGRYQMSYCIRIDNVESDAIYTRTRLVTSNRTVQPTIIDLRNLSGDPAYWHFQVSILVDMDANDTAHVTYNQSQGVTQADVKNASFFSGFLAC